MSDVDMEMSPRSDSEESEVENPPTPGSGSVHGEDSEVDDNETSSEVVLKENERNPDEEDDQSEEKHSVASPISPISPNNVASPISPQNVASPISPNNAVSPISPNNAASGDEEANDNMEIDEEDVEQADNNEQGEEKEILEEKDSSEVSVSSRNANEENSNDSNKEDVNIELSDKNEASNLKDESPSLEERNKTSLPKDNENETESETKVDKESEKENDIKEDENDEKESSSKNNSGNLEDSDLLNITEISDLSVDLTGDEAAIVQDILQGAGDDELLAGDGENPVADDQEKTPEEKSHKPSRDNDNENEEQPGGTGELLNDIFGSSDEDEEFQGFEEDELHGKTKIKKNRKTKPEKKGAIVSDDDEEAPKESGSQAETKPAEDETLTVPPPQDSESDDDEKQKSQVFVNDFDRMMEQKKEERGKAYRRRKNVDIINDNDDLVAGIIKKMQEAAQEDRLANEAKQAATKKLKLLPSVLKHMLKIDLMLIFVDSNVLPVLKEWISPLPDGSLPHIQIREGILKILEQLPPVDSGALKVSGIGKAVMYLFRHPKESRKNKERAGKIISEWSRPIFGVTANFKSMSREEREERDYANMSKRRRLSSDGIDGGRTPKRIENAIKSDSKKLRPGDKGWCMRARVPAPSNKDYVVRPKSNVEFMDFSKTSKKTLNRFEKQKRKMAEKKTSSKQRAVEISLEGRNMSL